MIANAWRDLRLIARGLTKRPGLILAAILTLAFFLYEVRAVDWLTYTLIAALLLAVALMACWIPARRAAKVDPLVALRCD